MFGSRTQYDSILDPSPNLRPWVDEEKPPTISLCMIVRDEEKNLPRCLESVRGVVDFIVVVATEPADRIINYPVAVWRHPWENDFAKARNFSLEHAHSDWILFLDADEELADPAVLRTIVNNAPEDIEGYFCTIKSFVGDGTESQDDIVFRLFRNRPEYRFEGAVHEQIIESIRRHQGRECFGMAQNLEIIHHGFTRAEIERKQKRGRNLAMIEAGPPEDGDTFRAYQYGMELMVAERWNDALAQFQRAAQQLDRRHKHVPKMIRAVVVALIESGRPERALAVARIGVRLFPDYADLWYYAGVLAKDRDLQRAKEYLREALDTPEQPAHFSSFEGARGFRTMGQLGWIEEAFGNPVGAETWYRMALEDRPDCAEVKEALDRLAIQGEGPGALDDWELFRLLLTVVHGDGEFDVVLEVGEGRRSYRVSAEDLGRVIEGRGE